MLHEEAQARARYLSEDEPRARERARKHWLHVMNQWSNIKMPSDEALRLAKELDRSDS